MRRQLALATAITAVTTSFVTIGPAAAPAAASCPDRDGTLHGTPPRAYAVGVGDTAFYVDDRDLADLNDNGDSGGLWIYAETNEVRGLQRGGSSYQFAQMRNLGLPTNVPYVGPTETPAGTLFANGLGGTDLEETAGSHDDCVQTDEDDRVPADTIVF